MVSIRARHHWRAIPMPPCATTRSSGFQSAPAITGGRSAFRPGPTDSSACFNPRPPSLAGDPRRPGAARGWNGFNPRPPSLAGDPTALAAASTRRAVSIRARHHWRAIRRQPGRRRRQGQVSIRARHHWRAILRHAQVSVTAGMFQSAPAITGGRSSMAALRSASAWAFQSAPAITGGRSRQRRQDGAGDASFNPRPPSLAGDPRAHRGNHHRRVVSIRARHHWRAIHARSEALTALIQFQSAPAITGGRSRQGRGPARNLF